MEYLSPKSIIENYSENTLAGTPYSTGSLSQLLKNEKLQLIRGVERLEPLLRAKLPFFSPTVSVIRLFNSLWLEGEETGRIVASSSFHGHPRFDFFRVQDSAVRGCLLFTVGQSSLVLIQRLQAEEPDEVLQVPRYTLTDEFDLVGIDQPSKLLYLLPDPSNNGFFWENTFYENYLQS